MRTNVDYKALRCLIYVNTKKKRILVVFNLIFFDNHILKFRSLT